MKRRSLIALVFALPLLTFASMARALDIQPYTATALQQLQGAGKPVAVHFHADWCSTCKAQAKVFKNLQSDPQLNNVTLLVAHYDDERELKKTMNVRAQSVVVIFKGSKETARIGGETKPNKIKSALLTSL